MQEEDSLRVVDSFDAAWNAHDEEGVFDLFAEEAVARLVPAPPGEPEDYEGKSQLKDLVWRHMPGFHVLGAIPRQNGARVSRRLHGPPARPGTTSESAARRCPLSGPSPRRGRSPRESLRDLMRPAAPRMEPDPGGLAEIQIARLPPPFRRPRHGF